MVASALCQPSSTHSTYSHWAFQLLALQSGTLSRILSGTWRSVQTVLDVYLKRICLLNTSASSTLGIVNDNALYKSTSLLTYIHTYVHTYVHTLRVRKGEPLNCFVTLSNTDRFTKILTDFQNSFNDRLTSSKVAMKSILNIPPCLKHVTSLPCEILMFKESVMLKN